MWMRTIRKSGIPLDRRGGRFRGLVHLLAARRSRRDRREGGRTRAVRAVAVLLVTLLSLSAAACNYSFRAGAGFPDHIRTVAVLPFENQTNRFELTDELHQQLLQELPPALGIQPGGENTADAVVRGVITDYDVSAPSYRQGDAGRAEVLQREVSLRVQVQIIDREQNLILWEDRGLRERGQYLEASETEEVARAEAIELLVQAIVDGAQSNW